ncbi:MULTISPECIES: WYL domain-containing protein [Aeromonas]|uniref:WYL domain-containing protein n=1 Tax=Aeromonas TaxID=642 RepID=UPI0025B6FF2F|nr:WYL domain-containing protein [Aeromonas caviae]MDX7770950.1 WYL domain-containing protein [Aeromonas caviae]
MFDLNSAEQQSTRKLSAKLIIGILFIPFIFAWFTLEKGYRPVARIAAFSWLTLNLLLLVTDSGSANWGIVLFLCGAGMLSAIWFGKWRPWISVQNIADRVPQKSVDKSQAKVGPVFSKKGNKPAPEFSYNPVATKATSSDALDKFEQSLTTLWAGYISGVEFTYVSFDGERSRRQVDVEELVFNDRGQFYIRGFCHKRIEQRTFKVRNIETKFKVGSKRYEFDDWCTQVLGLPADVIDDIQSLDHR